MRVLIIGSEGFIGSNLVRFFKNKGVEVYSADIVLKQEFNYFAVNAEFPDFGRLFYNQKYDVCINASGAANVQFSFQNPALDYTLNVSNVFHILEALRQFNPSCKFINFSSAAVYGNPQYLPIDEKHPISPLSPYGLHKYHSEQVCKEFYTFYSIPTISLRVFSAYGPGLKKQLFWDLFNKYRKGEELVLYGTGRESRDFIFIDDLCEAIHCIIMNGTMNGAVINVSSGTETTIGRAVSVFTQLLNKEIVYKFSGEERAGDPINWLANIQALNQYGFNPIISFEDGIGRTIEWLREQKLG